MTTAAQLVRTAAGFVGTTEHPRGTNDTPFAGIAGHPNGQPWCATFVVATARRAGLELPPGATSAYCPSDEAAYKRAGRLGTRPKVGAQFFLWFPSMGRVAHTGWVSAVRGGSVLTIEGNTNTDGSRDGYEVARRCRSARAAGGRVGIRSYGYPAYSSPVTTVTRTLSGELRSPQVMAVQRRLIKLGFLAAGQDDGEFGPVTEAAVFRFKKAHGFDGCDHNGFVGRGTVRLLGPTFVWAG